MSQYEVTFIVSPMEEHTEDAVFNRFDCVSGETHGGKPFITLTAEGPTAVEAMKTAALTLQFELGVYVHRVEFDLATRAELAYRLDKTPQTVGYWIRGERRVADPFPERFNDVAGGVWLWGDVVAWVRAVLGEDPAAGLLFPSRAEIDEVNDCLRREFAPADEPGFKILVKTHRRQGVAEVVEFIDVGSPVRSWSAIMRGHHHAHWASWFEAQDRDDANA